MSFAKITTIHAKLVDIISGELSDYRRIPNPYVSEANNQLILAKAYGVGIGPGARIQLEYGKATAGYERAFNVVLSQQMTATAHDITAREAIERSIVQDFVKINNLLEKNVTLDGLAYDSEYIDDSGIEFIDAELGKFVTLNVNYLVRYTETP